MYFRFVTGNHYVKEYEFKLSDELFKRSNRLNNINVVSFNDEYAIILIRLVIKRSTASSPIKTDEINRALFLKNKVNPNLVVNSLQDFGIRGCISIKELEEVAFGKANNSKHKSRVLSALKDNKMFNFVGFYFNLFQIKTRLLFLRALKQSNKTMNKSGLAIAVLGTDGSGKTSVVKELKKLFSKKTSCKVYYLGGNSKTYSIRTRLFYYLYKILRVFSPYKEKYYIAWFLYYLSISLLEYGKAIDRKNKIKSGNEIAKKRMASNI